MNGEGRELHLGSEAPVVCATAAVNGLAFSSYQTWAFRRAELASFVNTPFVCPNGKHAVMGPVRTLDPRAHGGDRLVAIAERCLAGLAEELALVPPQTPIAVFLCLPERMGDTDRHARFRAQRDRVRGAVEAALADRGLAPQVTVVARDHAGLAFALLDAAAALASRRFSLALVGGLDTYYDPPVVEALVAGGRLYDGENLDSFIPGEGGAFALLAEPSYGRARKLPALAVVESVATGQEVAAFDADVPCLGLGLSRPAVAVAEHLQREKRTLDWWLSDATAEDVRVQEFQLAWPRAAHLAMTSDSVVECPYENLGDLGAAFLPTALAIAVEGFGRGDPPARTCLLTGSSPAGDRGVVLLGLAS